MDSKNLVYKLRKQHRVKVGVRHYRYVIRKDADVKNGEYSGELHLENVTKDNKNQFSHIDGFGGITTVRLTFPDGKNYEMESRCRSGEAFVKRLGIAICVGRILKKRKQEGIDDNIS